MSYLSGKRLVWGCRARDVFGLCSCAKAMHPSCFHAITLKDKNSIPMTNLPDNQVVCTKNCYSSIIKVLSGSQSGCCIWNNDFRGGAQNSNTSMKILLDWIMEKRKYIYYCGKTNNGVEKQHFAATLVEKMMVATKLNSMQNKWWKRYDNLENISEKHTCLQHQKKVLAFRKNGKETFQDVVKRKCYGQSISHWTQSNQLQLKQTKLLLRKW